MIALLDALRARTNDYSAEERRFREITGRPLVGDPLDRRNGDPLPVTKSASVVIAAWNARNTIRQVMLAIEASTFNERYGSQLEVVVVDDGSTDDTWQLLKRLRCNLNLHLVRQQNFGQYSALNLAIDAAQGDIIISCDDDMILTPGTIEAMMLRHEVLDNVLLIGFRYHGVADDPRIRADRIVSHLHGLPVAFERDERVTFHWAGWPESLCAETNHLKDLHGAQQLYVTDGVSLDGDAWDLPRMVYGALFSLPRRDYAEMGGYDELFVGWGFGDTLIGAKAFAVGKYIVPVYEAVGFHVAHADRRPNKWADAEMNFARLQQLRALDVRAAMAAPQRDRGTLERLHRRRRSEGASRVRCDRSIVAESAVARGTRSLALGEYRLAFEAFAAAPSPRRLAGQGRAFDRLGDYASAAACFEECCRLDPEDGESAARLAMALAGQGHFAEGQRRLRQASSCPRNAAWLGHLTSHSGTEHASRGSRYSEQQLYRWAARDFEAALLHDPENREWTAARQTARSAVEFSG
jgi:glycosyltransferase involved in cell wall biosynthesis